MLIADYSPLSLDGAINRNSITSLRYGASMTSVLMLAVLVVSLILALITLNRLKVKSGWKLIIKFNFECFVTPSKVMQRSGKSQKIVGVKITKVNFVVKPELHVIPCKSLKDTVEWILINTTEKAIISHCRYAKCINFTFYIVFPLPCSTCLGPTLIAQFINPLPTRPLRSAYMDRTVEVFN